MADYHLPQYRIPKEGLEHADFRETGRDLSQCLVFLTFHSLKHVASTRINTQDLMEDTIGLNGRAGLRKNGSF